MRHPNSSFFPRASWGFAKPSLGWRIGLVRGRHEDTSQIEGSQRPTSRTISTVEHSILQLQWIDTLSWFWPPEIQFQFDWTADKTRRTQSEVGSWVKPQGTEEVCGCLAVHTWELREFAETLGEQDYVRDPDAVVSRANGAGFSDSGHPQAHCSQKITELGVGQANTCRQSIGNWQMTTRGLSAFC